MIPIHAILRLTSILVVVLIRWFCSSAEDEVVWVAIVMSLGLGHYLLAIVYSQRQIIQSFSQPASAVPLLILLLLGSTLYLPVIGAARVLPTYRQIVLLFFFGLHHVFNEVFLTSRLITPQHYARTWLYRTNGVVLHLLLYFFLLRNDPILRLTFYDISLESARHLVNALFAGLIVSYLVFFFSLYQMRRYLRGARWIDACAFELGAVALIVISFGRYRFEFLDIVCYHFIFWVIYPATKLWSQGRGPLLRYVLWTVALTGGLLLVSPIGVVPYKYGLDRPSFYSEQFTLWSFIHITGSFAMSNANPWWIVRWFRPRAAW